MICIQKLMAKRFLLAIAATATLVGCAPQPEKPFTEQLREALETAAPGDVIEIPAGTFTFKRSLILNTDNVTIRGAGMDQSVLSFKGQVAGAEGLSVNTSIGSGDSDITFQQNIRRLHRINPVSAIFCIGPIGPLGSDPAWINLY